MKIPVILNRFWQRLFLHFLMHWLLLSNDCCVQLQSQKLDVMYRICMSERTISFQLIGNVWFFIKPYSNNHPSEMRSPRESWWANKVHGKSLESWCDWWTKGILYKHVHCSFFVPEYPLYTQLDHAYVAIFP